MIEATQDGPPVPGERQGELKDPPALHDGRQHAAVDRPQRVPPLSFHERVDTG
jgi:hypothetical protein